MREQVKRRLHVRSVFAKKPERVIAIDGKTIRGTLDKGDKAFVHMVGAWSCENGISLAQIAVDEKSNEITAMPRLIGMLDIRGAVITSDAMGCQRELAGLVKQKGGDYILAVKANQKLLMEGIEETCALPRPVSHHTETDCGHGRVEVRICSVCRNLSRIPGAWNWNGLAALVRVVAARHNKKTRHRIFPASTAWHWQSSKHACPLRTPQKLERQEIKGRSVRGVPGAITSPGRETGGCPSTMPSGIKQEQRNMLEERHALAPIHPTRKPKAPAPSGTGAYFQTVP